MQPFIIEGETVLMKFRHLILNVSFYNDDLSAHDKVNPHF
jgi:hypothetical protein